MQHSVCEIFVIRILDLSVIVNLLHGRTNMLVLVRILSS